MLTELLPTAELVERASTARNSLVGSGLARVITPSYPAGGIALLPHCHLILLTMLYAPSPLIPNKFACRALFALPRFLILTVLLTSLSFGSTQQNTWYACLFAGHFALCLQLPLEFCFV